MPEILRLPVSQPLSSAAALMVGAKLYLYVTGTSTPQNGYTDYALTVPASNPLVADASGVFAQTFLVNTPRYRVVLKTSADVTLFTWDDVGPDTASSLGVPTLAGSNVFTGTSTKFSSSEMRILLDETDAGTDKRLWDIDINAGVLKLRTRTDADGAGIDVLTVTRGTTTAVSSITLYQGTVNLPAFTKSTFTPSSWVGFSASPSGTISYQTIGRMIYLIIDSVTAVGTSNTTGFGFNGLPASLQPSTNTLAQYPCVLVDNGIAVTGAFSFGTPTGRVNFSMGSPLNAAGFTNSGTKGLTQGVVLAYPL